MNFEYENMKFVKFDILTIGSLGLKSCIKDLLARDVAQWQCACLASERENNYRSTQQTELTMMGQARTNEHRDRRETTSHSKVHDHGSL